MEFEEYKFATPNYALSVALRDEILRRPLGLGFSEMELSMEWESYHLGGFDNNRKLIACLVLQPLNEQEIKMRQVAVHADAQGKGVGRLLVNFSERFAKSKGFQKMTLNARKTVKDFYTRLDYEVLGQEFEEVGIPHLKMHKVL